MFVQSAAWQNLLKHHDAMRGKNISDIVLQSPDRLTDCEIALDGLRLNYALNAVTSETLVLLMQVAEARDVAGWRERMFRGDKINTSENRAALHGALRQNSSTPVMLDGRDVMPDIAAMRAQMTKLVSAIRGGEWKGATGKPLSHIVNIGIGGSDLGPRLIAGALAPTSDKITTTFVSNVDAADLLPKLQNLNPAETLFVVVSKTFTTQETLLNARTAREWLVKNLGASAISKHFFAVTTNTTAAESFGIAKDSILPMWDWVGGRFSLWSSVGFSAALALGMENFNRLLEGAAAMDDHFRKAPLAKNIPALLAMLGIWNCNVLGARVHAVLPYSERLHDLPRYLQQLEMESNGKTAARDGGDAELSTAPLIFGESGTVGQHSFHQWLHQGSDPVSADFIGVVHDDFAQPEHHRVLLANMVAQAGALAFGQRHAALRHEVYPGNRPSSLLMLNKLDSYHLGMLLALYEHKVFVQSVIWDINPFDQPGVELGKKLANKILAADKQSDQVSQFIDNLYNKFAIST